MTIAIADDTLVLILAGGRGSRLREMTDRRAKPAVYFGGNWRIIDFTLSNCFNSNLFKIGVITQYEAHSLLRHLQHAWSFMPRERGYFVDMLPARQQVDETMWYRGTADAVWQNVVLMKEHYKPKYVLILAGDHISRGAKCTVGSIEVKRSEAKEFGVMAVDERLLWKNRPTRRLCARNRIRRWLQWGFMYLMPITFTKRWLAKSSSTIPATISEKTSSPKP